MLTAPIAPIAIPVGIVSPSKTPPNASVEDDVFDNSVFTSPILLFIFLKVSETPPIAEDIFPTAPIIGPAPATMPPIVKIASCESSSNSVKALAQSVIFSIAFVANGSKLSVKSPNAVFKASNALDILPFIVLDAFSMLL